MNKSDFVQPGRHFLQIPGPSNVPDRVLRAISRPTIDHRGPEFSRLFLDLLERLKLLFKTSGPIMIFPSSGTGAWEAALVNTLSPGDRVLMFETGQFATFWCDMVLNLGLEVEWVPGDWRHGVDPAVVKSMLLKDSGRTIKAIAIVHNETSTGVMCNLAKIRQAIDSVGNPALFLVDTISSLGCTDFRHDEWGIDVSICGSQKGLMLPPGLGLNAVSEKALAASKNATLPKSYWAWEPMLKTNAQGFTPYTPASNLFFGLEESVNMFFEEGLDNVYARHNRLAEATRRAVRAWDLEILCLDPDCYSSSLTTVLLPEGNDADALRKVILEKFNLALGSGLGKVQGKVFRIGHLGDFNELMLAGTLCGIEMGLGLAGVPHKKGGVNAALEFLSDGSKDNK